MADQHERLLSPGVIGSMELRNRIVLPAMDQNVCTEDGLLTEANLDHYEQRADGGVGLLIVETSAVMYPVGATSRVQPSVGSDDCIEGFRALADRVHALGSKVIVQICHHGKTALVDTAEGRKQTVASVPLPKMDMGGFIQDLTMDEMMKMAEKTDGAMPTHRAATTDDLLLVVDAFADAAERVQRAGCDGIEVHAAHGYLISMFLSPHWNWRTDDYGGDVHRRTRFLREVVAAIRARCGADFAIVVRLDAKEFRIDEGITPKFAARHAEAAVEAGADAIHVSAIGAPDSGVAFTDGPLPWQLGQYRDITRPIRAAVDVPVIAVGRITPDIGEEMIENGECDFVSMGRQLLADPQLPRRLADGRPDLVRPCINCFVCVAENFWSAAPKCAVNALLGRPNALRPSRAAAARKIAIIGGGPAGLEAARVAADRGHHVTIYERAPHLGGTARFSSMTTPINGSLVDYLIASVNELGVEIHTSTEATPELIRDGGFDRVVVATGAVRGRPSVPGSDRAHVLTGDDLRAMLTGDDPVAARRLPRWQRLALGTAQRTRVLSPARVRTLSRAWMPIGQRVAIVGGGLVGVEIAEFLAERGRSVTVLESGPDAATEMAHPRRWRALHEARENGVSIIVNSRLVEIRDRGVIYDVADGDDGKKRRIVLTADHVIIASGVSPDRSLADRLADAGIEAEVIGDAADVGYIEGAIRTGYDLGVSIA